MNKLRIFLLVLLSITFACSAKKEAGNTLRMRLVEDPAYLDWNLASDTNSGVVVMRIQEGLTAQDDQSTVIPSLAESWTVSDDGLTYTFKIRQEAKWSDGKPVVSQNFVDSWERLLNPTTASQYAYFIFMVEGAEEYNSGTLKDFSKVGIKAVDPKTVQIKINFPAPYFTYIPGFSVTYPIRKDLIEKYGDKWVEPDKIVTAGPYTIESYARNSKLLLTKNPHYWNKTVLEQAPDKIEFRIVSEESTAVNLFNNGNLDIVRNLPTIQVPILQKKPEFFRSNAFRSYYIGFTLNHKQVKDKRVREALALSIDRKEVAKALSNIVTPESSWIPNGMMGYSEGVGLEFNPKKAKEIWASIDNKPAFIETFFNSAELHKTVAENLQGQWKRHLGLEVKVTLQEWKVFLKSTLSGTLPVFRFGWSADYPDPDNYMNLFYCNSGNNRHEFCNKEFDRLVKAAAIETDIEKRTELYTKAQKILLQDEVAIIPLFTSPNLHLVSKRVKGFYTNPMGNFSNLNLKLVNEK